jgi:hypothetical protein
MNAGKKIFEFLHPTAGEFTLVSLQFGERQLRSATEARRLFGSISAISTRMKLTFNRGSKRTWFNGVDWRCFPIHEDWERIVAGRHEDRSVPMGHPERSPEADKKSANAVALGCMDWGDF